MKWKSIILSIVTLFSIFFFAPTDVKASDLQLAGATKLGALYVDTDKTETLRKNDAFYLTVFAEEKFTDKAYLKELRKDEKLKDVVGAVYLFLFDNRGSSYCVAANYLIDGQGKVCLDNGSDMKMKRLTAKDKTMLNAYTLSLKELENQKRFQKKFLKKAN